MKNYFRKIFINTVAAALIAAAFASSAAAAEIRCHILCINDPHSNILPHMEAESISSDVAVKNGGMCRALYLVQEEKKSIQSSGSGPVFLIEGGDIMLGKKGSAFGGKPEYDSLAFMGFDVGVLGNHDFDGGVKTLSELVQNLKFPVLASNVQFEDAKLQNGFKRTAIIKRGGVTIGCFGFVPTELKSIITKPNGFEVDQDIAFQAKKYVAELRAQKVDIIVAVDHIGLDSDMQLAKKVSGIDVIVGGHSHDAVRGKVIVAGPDGHQTIYGQAGLDGRFAGRFDIVMKDGRLDPEKSSWKLLEVQPDTPEVKEVGDIGREAQKELSEALGIGNPVVTFTKTSDALYPTVRSKEAGIGDMAADALRWKAKAQTGIINGGGLRIGRIIPKGPLSPTDMLDLFPYGNDVIRVAVTGAELRKQLEISASALKRDGEKFDPSMRPDNGEFLQISGLKVTYNLMAQPALVQNRKTIQSGHRVARVMVQTKKGWAPLKDEKIYTVGTTDFVARYWDVKSRRDLGVSEMSAVDDYCDGVLHRTTDSKTDGRIRIIETGSQSNDGL